MLGVDDGHESTEGSPTSDESAQSKMHPTSTSSDHRSAGYPQPVWETKGCGGCSLLPESTPTNVPDQRRGSSLPADGNPDQDSDDASTEAPPNEDTDEELRKERPCFTHIFDHEKRVWHQFSSPIRDKLRENYLEQKSKSFYDWDDTKVIVWDVLGEPSPECFPEVRPGYRFTPDGNKDTMLARLTLVGRGCLSLAALLMYWKIGLCFPDLVRPILQCIPRVYKVGVLIVGGSRLLP